ncbi:hypothetical protein GQ44DRAFT_658035 [Phaeosphaeriaceae sp. PMI808]|nr:hypothetical protein GQ44DRAFT_658035 [Phaeosphaeriaceae sp. PMI808]
MHKKIAHWVETKRYVDEPEILPWYMKDLGDLDFRARDLLENYSNVPQVEVEAHVRKVRDEAFKVYPYPCVGNWGFLNLRVVSTPVYSEVVDRLKNGERCLDFGCCMGQYIRKFIHDGVPRENLYGSDVTGDFWNIGYDLFRDKSTLNVKFIKADVFDEDSGLKELDGQLNLVLAASVFHLFDWEGQVKAAKRVIRLLKAEPGVMIFGRQGGMPTAGSLGAITRNHNPFWHNAESWAKLWKQVGDETGSKWEVDASLGEDDLKKRMNTELVPAGTTSLTFSIRRV